MGQADRRRHGPAARGGALMTTVLRGVWWWLTSVMGDHDYERYVEHATRTHPDSPVMTEREYWRRRHDEQDRNPGARCC